MACAAPRDLDPVPAGLLSSQAPEIGLGEERRGVPRALQAERPAIILPAGAHPIRGH